MFRYKRCRFAFLDIHYSLNIMKNIAFTFPGQGCQYEEMGVELYSTNNTFKTNIDQCNQLYEEISGINLMSAYGFCQSLMAADDLKDPLVSVPCITIVQISLIEVLKAQLIIPDIVFGHSIGEFACAYASGMLTIKDTLRVTYHCSKGMSMMDRGKMVAYFGSVEDFHRVSDTSCFIAAVNTKDKLTISGTSENCERLIRLSQAHRIKAFDIQTINRPYHSPLTHVMKDYLLSNLSDIRPQIPQRKFMSSVYTKYLASDDLNADYWWNNMNKPVQFYEACNKIENIDIIVEISPRSIFSRYIYQNFPDTLFVPIQTAKPINQNIQIIKKHLRKHSPSYQLWKILKNHPILENIKLKSHNEIDFRNSDRCVEPLELALKVKHIFEDADYPMLFDDIVSILHKDLIATYIPVRVDFISLLTKSDLHELNISYQLVCDSQTKCVYDIDVANILQVRGLVMIKCSEVGKKYIKV